ncbi:MULTISPECIES: YceI family protein [unclassified Salinibacterium]|uniref:YceI family protein n=1 Tax=unclassified Salinibacterium TaxID=2632331 RepID=UPI0018CEA45B|nr:MULTISPECIES: YceI family protein [unclassified Salinibacterium]MBH0053026.1 YceI family protein [Salinibacterium sp. SWN139]MBH0082290.1 YceI family protein [Salinibacterium sp. SWN167]
MTTSLDTHTNFAVGTWQLDPTHSTVAFTVKHLMISKVRGTFDGFSGTIVTSEVPAENSISATIDMATINTNQPDRDGHLRTNDFFNVEEFPTATFTSTSMDIDGDDLTIEGDLTLRGVTKPVTLKGEFGGIATNPYGQTVAAASATTVINRTEFGINYNAALETGGVLLGENITLTFDLQAVLQK